MTVAPQYNVALQRKCATNTHLCNKSLSDGGERLASERRDLPICAQTRLNCGVNKARGEVRRFNRFPKYGQICSEPTEAYESFTTSLVRMMLPNLHPLRQALMVVISEEEPERPTY